MRLVAGFAKSLTVILVSLLVLEFGLLLVRANVPPVLALSEPVVTDLSVTINGFVTSGTGGAIVYRIHWEWGDGIEDYNRGFEANHTYQDYGTYTIKVTAYQSDGLNATESKIVHLRRRIFISANGSVDPPTAPISTFDNVSYFMTSDIDTSIVVQRDHIQIDGASYKLRGTGALYSQGILISEKSDVTIRNLDVEGFWWGICLLYSPRNRIEGNNLTANGECGIKLYYSSDNNVSGNNLRNNKYGIWLEGSSNNTIYRNNFLDNYPYQAYIRESASFWDNGAEGNYWSNYAGKDSDGNGIGDESYVIDEINRDSHPLTKPWSQNGTVFMEAPVWGQFWFWAMIALGAAGLVSSMWGLRYYRKLKRQKEGFLAYESELEKLQISHVERARARFIKDAIEHEEKVDDFRRKYGVSIRPARTFEEAIRKLGVQKED